MPQEVLEETAPPLDTEPSSRTGEGFSIAIKLDGRSMQEVPGARIVVLGIALFVALTSSALGAYFLSGDATGLGASMQTSVTQCPMTQ